MDRLGLEEECLNIDELLVVELLDCVDSSRTRTVALSDFANKTMTESILGQLESRTSHPVAIAPGTDLVTKRTGPYYPVVIAPGTGLMMPERSSLHSSSRGR